MDDAIDRAYEIRRGTPAMSGAGMVHSNILLAGSGHRHTVHKHAGGKHHHAGGKRSVKAAAKLAVAEALDRLKSM